MWELFFTFFKIGLFTFGGGYSMLAMIKREISDNKKWVSEEEVTDIFAIGQCTPGVIAVNTATYIGCKLKGVKGAVMSTLGVITPSFIIIIILAAFVQTFYEFKIVQDALWGIRIAVAGLIITAFVRITKKNITDWQGVLIFAVALALFAGANFAVQIIILLAAAAGIVIKSVSGRVK